MKNLLLINILSVFLLFSCASSVSRPSQSKTSGTWKISNVSYSESNVKVKAFGSFDAQCLVNSTWYFIANNNSGNLNINGSDSGCPSVTQNFKWYIDPQNMFVFKPLGEGDKAKNIVSGYTYQYQSVSESEFNLVQTVDGVKIVYHFTKLSSGKLN